MLSTLTEPSRWLRDHATRLNTLDPDAPLDDLEPFREIVGDARVVAVGESAHFLQEFARARQRVLRFLVERCGFSVFAFEFGFSEGFALDRWVQGEGAESDLAEVSEAASAWGAGDLMRFAASVAVIVIRRPDRNDGAMRALRSQV